MELSAEYEAEQRELEEKVKYVGIKELTPAIVNEFIKKIIVHAPEKADEKRVQKVDIIFNFAGEINFLSATQRKRQSAQEHKKTVQPL